MTAMNEIIQQEVTKALHQSGWGKEHSVMITRTKNPEHGDFSCNIALILAKTLELPPMKIARKLQSVIKHSEITRVDVASPGFLNFFTTQDFSPLIQSILDHDAQFFTPDIGKQQPIYLEYVSANPTGPLHVGHGRSAAYGSSLANVLRTTGFNVHTEYYVNDAGLQIDILTTSMWLRILKQDIPKGCYSGQYLIDMVKHAPTIPMQVPNNLEAILQQWSDDEPTLTIDALIACCKKALGENYPALHAWVVDHISEGIRDDLNDFRVNFDHWYYESTLVKNQAIEKLVETLESSGATYEKDGALWFASSKFEDEKDRVLKRSNGIWTYFANDLAYHHHKMQTSPGRIIDIFGADHHGYVARIEAGLKALGLSTEHFKTVLIQFANLYRGEEKIPMSTRGGQFVTLSDLYKEVGIDAARFFYCMRRSDQHLDFDLELAKSQNSQNPVYYIQYAHARIKSIFGKHGQYIPSPEHWQQPSDIEIEILETLNQYPEVLIRVSQNLELYRLPQYLLKIATLFHKYYNSTPILTPQDNERYHRLLLCALVAKCLHSGLSLLKIDAPESM